MQIYVDYVGCEKRKLDAQKVIDYIVQNEEGVTHSIEESDVQIVVTCAYTHEFEDASFSKIREIANKKGDNSKIIVGGCLPSINPDKFRETKLFGTFSPRTLENLDNYLNFNVTMENISDPNKTLFDERAWSSISTDFRTAAQEEYEEAKKGFKIRINQGCMGNCSYCVIKKATGKLKSKKLNEVLFEFKKGLDAGENIFFITGGDTGAWGLDIRDNITTLLTKIFALDADFKLYFHDFNIYWLLKYQQELLEIFQRNHNRIGAVCFPIQSGSDRILKLMRRPNRSKDSLEVLKRLKERAPKIKIGTHIIVGFPSETNDDFYKTLNFVKDAPLDFIMCYEYSEHKLADSSKLLDKVPREVIEDRHGKIIETSRQKTNDPSSIET